MRVVLQRVTEASVLVEDRITGSIGTGLVVLLGIEDADGEEDVEWQAKKISNMRIFEDEAGKMNLSLKEVNGSLLVVSQFTLHASTKKGNRPSFIKAAEPDHAIPLYKQFIEVCRNKSGLNVETGEFGAMMDVSLTNNGPVTIILDSKNKD